MTENWPSGWRKIRSYGFLGRFLLAAVLIAAGILKLTSGEAALLLTGYQFLPGVAAAAVGTVLPWLEISLGIGLLSGWRPRFFLGIALLLIPAFMLSNLYSLISGNSHLCRCLGATLTLTHGQSLGLDILMLGLALAAFISPPARAGGPGFSFLKRRWGAAALSLVLTVAILGSVLPSAALAAADPEIDSTPAGDSGLTPRQYPAMHPTPRQLAAWQDNYQNAPRFSAPAGILADSAAGTLPQAFSLLPLLDYIPEERDQGNAGNCWAWAGTGISEIALNVSQGIPDRLSVQYLDSHYYNQGARAGCGGLLESFTEFYNGNPDYWYDPADIAHIVVPWSNLGAEYRDWSYSVCNSYSGSVVETAPSYPIRDSLTVQTIETAQVSQAEAIANIKSALLANQAVFLAFYVPSTTSLDYGTNWMDFVKFWSFQSEAAVWEPDFGAGLTWPEDISGHAVLCVGYDDSDNSWLVLNSWGVMEDRPNGLFRLSQDLPYDGTYNYYGEEYNFIEWQILTDIYDPAVPSVSLDGAQISGPSGAVVLGRLTGLAGNPAVEVYFEYGPDQNYGYVTAKQTLSATGSFSAELSGLTAGQPCHYRAVAVAGETAPEGLSGDAVLVTAELPFGDTAVATLPASNIRETAGTLNARLDNPGIDGSARVYFEYGPDTAYGYTTLSADQYSNAVFSRRVRGLTAGQSYHYRAVAEGNITVYGQDMTFYTLVFPRVSSLEATGVTSNSAILKARLEMVGSVSPVNAFFQWWPLESGSTSATPYQALTQPGEYSARITGLEPETDYVFRAKVISSDIVYGELMQFRTPALTRPARPVLTSPPDGARLDTLTPLLAWESRSLAAGYTLQISASPFFRQRVLYLTDIVENSYSVPPGILDYAAVYYWQVKAVNPAGSSPWSFTSSFSVINVAEPAAPSNLRVVSVGPDSVGLAWDSASPADLTGFRIEKARGAGAFVQMGQVSRRVTASTVTGLNSDTAYRFRVAACTRAGERQYSDIVSATTPPPLPSRPRLVSPSALSTVNSLTPTLQWTAAAGAATYEIQVASDLAFSDIVTRISGLEATRWTVAPALDFESAYYWRVRAVNPAGHSDWSTVRVFHTPYPDYSSTRTSGFGFSFD